MVHEHTLAPSISNDTKPIIKMTISPHKHIRQLGIVFAAVLAVLAIWLIVAESLRPAIPEFPIDSSTAKASAAHRAYAEWSAALGLVRGELWTECALTYADLFWSQGSNNAAHPEMINRARSIVERAAAYSPHDSRAWLLLAGFDALGRPSKAQVTGYLKMSYYTGANESALIPMRLLVSIRSGISGDDEMRRLVTREIQAVASNYPNLKSAIVTAYRNADAEDKRLIESTINEIDPHLLSTTGAPYPIPSR